MASLKPLFLFLFLSFLYFPTTTEATGVIFLGENCITNDTFTENSAFQLNLRTLLTSLSSNATGTTEFFNTTIAGISPADTVYGLFMCRGDVPSDLCQECVINATQRLGGPSSDTCPFSKGTIIWYDECMIRYSNRNFFSTVDTMPRIWVRNALNISDGDKENFMTLLYTTLNETADEAAKAPVGLKKYATKEANMSTSQTLFQTLYTLTQCTPDLTSQDCRRCLAKLIADVPWCCTYRIGGRLLYPSCNIRFEFYLFFRNSAAAAPSAQVPSAAKLEAKRKIRSSTIALIVVSTIVALPILFYLGCCFLKRKTRKSQKDILRENFGDEIITWESLQFDFATIEAATNKFSQENRIGKGGFGEVYKGVLKSNGEEIAVKRLSKRSEQGVIEFKNEVLLIAKLQHRNLVSLLGFCLGEEEKILVYEYVPNKSLDNFLFDHQEHRILNWSERYRIIEGITRGILYLHDRSRLKVIHRDLKPGNILLDNDMNPKISDFGLAKMVAIDHAQGSTNRVVGTYGYMAPEYAMHGKFSTKSDIFSFGVIVLEIVSGKRNSCSFTSHRVDDLLSNAWKQWNNQTPLQIMDPKLEESYAQNEVENCIQVGLLCVQEDPDVRPSMQTIISYFNGHSVKLPSPREPIFSSYSRGEPSNTTYDSRSTQLPDKSIAPSVNEMSISQFIPR